MARNNFKTDESDEKKVSVKGRGRTPNRNSRSRKDRGSTNGKTATNSSQPGMGTQLALDVTQFPFSGAIGRSLNPIDNTNAGPLTKVSTIIPGVCAIKLAPSVGYSYESTSAVNLASRNLYSFVTHANSRNASYEANDLMLYVLATSELFKLWQNGARAYGMARSYTVMNKYMPRHLIAPMGIDYDSLMSNLNDFRAGLNLLASRISSIVLPGNMPYTMRAFNLFSSVYADSENSRAQLYEFVPDGYWQYWEAAEETGGSLKYVAFTDTYTAKDYIVMLNGLASRILDSQYMNIMAADIIKAYGDQLYTLSEIPEDYTVLPVYSDEVLETINNAVAVGPLSSNTIVQTIPSVPDSAPFLTHVPMVAKDADHSDRQYMNAQTKVLLNTSYETLSPAQVVDRLAFSSYLEENPSDATKFLVHARTEIVTAIRYYFNPTNIMDYHTTYYNASKGSEIAAWRLAIVDQFNHHPMIKMFDDELTEMRVFGDIDNLSLITQLDFRNLTDAVVQLVFNVPV